MSGFLSQGVKRLGRSWQSISPSASGGAIFNPATLLPDGWWKGPFTGVPWIPTAPGNTHGNLNGLGTNPVAGSSLNGIASVHLDPSTRTALTSAGASSNFITASSGTMLVLFKATGTPIANQAAWYSENPLITTDSGDWGFSHAASGVRGGDGAAHNTPYVPLATGIWAMCAFRLSGTTGYVRVSQPSGTVDSTPQTGLISMAIDTSLQLGRNWNNTAYQNGDIMEILVWKRALLDSELDSMKSYLNTTYALTLT